MHRERDPILFGILLSNTNDSPNSPYQYNVAVDPVLDSGHGRNHGT